VGETVAVATLLWKGACEGVPQQQQQHHQQQQNCPPREQCFECEKDSTITLSILLALETLLGAILIAFPKSRVCIAAALDLVRAVRILKRTPPPVVVDDDVVDVEVPTASAPPAVQHVAPLPRAAPLAPKQPLLQQQQQQQQQIENWCKKTTYIRDPSFTNLAIIIHLIKKILIVGSLSVTKIIISHAIGIDLCSQLWADHLQLRI
jgi:hypothetical protein